MAEFEPTGHVLTDAAQGMHIALMEAVAGIAACGQHDPHAERAVLALIERHHPETDTLEVARTGKLYPGWWPQCVSCWMRYPCTDVMIMARILGVQIPEELK